MLQYSKILWTLVNNSLEMIIGMGTIILVTRVYSPVEVGAWTVFTTVFFLVTKLREGVIQTALIKFLSGQEKDKYYSVLKASFFTNITIETVLSSLVFLIGYLDYFKELSLLFLFYPLYSMPWAIYRWQLFVHQSKLRVEVIFKINVAILVVLLVGFSMLLFWKWQITDMIVILGFGAMSGSIVGLKVINPKLILIAKTTPELYKDMLSYGKFGMLRELTGTLSTRINVFLTAGFLTLSQTGLLGIAQRFTQLILIPNAAIQTLVFPKACELSSRDRKDELKVLYESSVAMLLAMFLPLVVLMVISAHSLILMFNGKDYLDAAPLLVIMIITVALYSPFGNAFGSVINAIGKPEMNMKVVVVNSIINICLSFSLVLTVGLYGAVLAPFITETFGFIWISKILKRELGISFERCFRQIPNSYATLFSAIKKKLRQQGVESI
ncbi:oligosaccharide flippase family protein [Candidatus Roizmanbacteria bacterium]|nr:oligosaccharide flippase family protein [Candidatus Roizmanbacteria bacterium]